MPTKSREGNAISMKLFKSLRYKLLSIITSIVNMSLDNEQFAREWKLAINTTTKIVAKKQKKNPGCEQTMTNYHPVSKSPFYVKDCREKYAAAVFDTL